MECPDIVIEEDYLSKPSPAKKANLGGTPEEVKKPRRRGKPIQVEKGKENDTQGGNKDVAQTNGIEMESDGEDDSDDTFPPIPPPQVSPELDEMLHHNYSFTGDEH